MPGLSCLSFGARRELTGGDKYIITTVAGLISAVKRSSVRNVTLSATPAARAFAVASRVRSGSMSMPTPRAPYIFAAAITIRPSPDPRSYTTSFGVIFASFSIASTTTDGVGTKMTSGWRAGCAC